MKAIYLGKANSRKENKLEDLFAIIFDAPRVKLSFFSVVCMIVRFKILLNKTRERTGYTYKCC